MMDRTVCLLLVFLFVVSAPSRGQLLSGPVPISSAAPPPVSSGSVFAVPAAGFSTTAAPDAFPAIVPFTLIAPRAGAAPGEPPSPIDTMTWVAPEQIVPGAFGAIAYNDRGAAFIRRGAFLAADADLDESLYLDPKNPIAYYNRAIANLALPTDEWRVLGDLYEAARLLKRPEIVKQYVPAWLPVEHVLAEVYLARAIAFERKERLSDADASYVEITRLGLDPSSPRSRFAGQKRIEVRVAQQFQPQQPAASALHDPLLQAIVMAQVAEADARAVEAEATAEEARARIEAARSASEKAQYDAHRWRRERFAKPASAAPLPPQVEAQEIHVRVEDARARAEEARARAEEAHIRVEKARLDAERLRRERFAPPPGAPVVDPQVEAEELSAQVMEARAKFEEARVKLEEARARAEKAKLEARRYQHAPVTPPDVDAESDDEEGNGEPATGEPREQENGEPATGEPGGDGQP